MSKPLITLDDYLTASGRYPDRLNHKELTPEIKANAKLLLTMVNGFLAELGITKVTVSSGWRPSAVNAAIANAAKKSLHLQGLAIDLADSDGKLDELISKNDKLKKKYGLWQEHMDHTKNWAHLDLNNRGNRKENTFIP